MRRTARTISFCAGLVLILAIVAGCGRISYGFKEKGQPNLLLDSAKTVRVEFIENNAPYRNPQLSPSLTERLRQKLLRQTKLTQTNGDADVVVTGQITDYSVTTSGISAGNGQRQTSVNRLTVTVSVTLTPSRSGADPLQVNASRSFDFPASQSLQQAEGQLLEEMVRNLTDEIFNQLFSNW